MDDNKNINTEPLTKKEKADVAGKDVAEVAARGAGRYFGGSLGGAAVDAALKTKAGQKIVGQASKQINKNPITRSVLAKNQQNISRAKPIVNSLMGSMGGGTEASMSDMDSYNDSYDDMNNNEIKGSGVVSGLWNKLSLKTKLIIIGCIAGLVFVVIFLIVLITPLMSLGIIDIGGIGSGTGGTTVGYTSISGNTKYWWPVGSNETTTQNGITYASGDPASMDVTSDFGDQESFRNSGHGGVDIGNAGNGPGVLNIIASRDGNVIYPNSESEIQFADNGYIGNPDGAGFGNYVKIQHDDGTITIYAHLAQNSITVFAGDTVKQGQVIGKMGNSGSTNGGTHLHFEVIANGARDYPLNYISSDEPRPSNAPIVGDTVKQSVCLNLKNIGIPDNGVAAILTNMQHESSFNLGALGDPDDNGVPTSYGLCQWHAGRRDELMSKYSDSYHTVYSQLEFLIYELENKPDYKATYNSIMDKDKSVYDSTYTFCTNFERPKNMQSKCSARGDESDSFAEYVYNGCQ